jgi:hypothetical protein
MPLELDAPPLAVEGYPDQLSYLPGETVQFHCSARTSTFSVEIARIGARRTIVWQRQGIPGQEPSVPVDAYAAGCGWPVAFSLRIPEAWRSGFYEVALRGDGDDGPAAHAFFVVRSPRPGQDSSILLVLSTNTYNAYNRWGGECLYTGATQVSFARPLERGYVVKPGGAYDGRVASIEPEGDPTHRRLLDYLAEHRLPLWSASAGWWNWERRFVQWAERQGYRLDLAVNADLEFQPGLLDGYRLMLSVGHDEYWSWAMRDATDDFVNREGNVAFFSGNAVYWQVRYEDEGRTMVCYKTAAHGRDPVLGTERQHLMSGMWSDPLIGRPETLTTGLSFCRGGYVRIGWAAPRSSGAYTVYRPDHWVFAGTGLRYGDLLGQGSYVVAYEVDGCAFTLVDGLPVPTHEDGTPDGSTILGASPAHLISITGEQCEAPPPLWASIDPPGDLEFTAMRLFGDASPENVAKVAHGNAVMGVFSRGGTVFHAGTADWAYGLDCDAQIQRVTRNVLDRLSAPASQTS